MPRFISLPLISALTALLLLTWPQEAAAQGETGNVCVRDYRSGAVCTANDVRIEALVPITVLEDCLSGTVGETEVIFETLVSSAGSPNRYDIGLFLALDGGSARDGDSCYHAFLDPPLTPTPIYGDKNTDSIQDITNGPWWDGVTDADQCGDLETNTQVFKTLPALRFACIDHNGDGSADVGVCTSWDNNTGTACNAVVDAFPGTNSKCRCDVVELGIAPAPAITVVKTPPTQTVLIGGTANFTFTVTSKTHVSNVNVSDNPPCTTLTGPVGDTNTDGVLTPGETWVYTCEVDNVLADFIDTVTVTGDGPLGPVDDTDTASTTVMISAVSLVKTGSFNDESGDGIAQAGETIAYSFEVTNSGSVTLNDVGVTDPMVAPITCPSGNPIPALAPGAVATCTGTYTVTQADVDAGQKVNTATAAGQDPSGNPVSDTDSETIPLTGAASVLLVKTGSFNDESGDGIAQAGETISYSFEVTNSGSVTLNDVGVTDPMVAPITCPSGNPIPALAPGAGATCTGTYIITQADVDAGQKVNTATAAGQDPSGNPVTDQDTTTVTLTGGPAISAVKLSDFLINGGDNDGSGTLSPGDSLQYIIDITNTGAGDALNVIFTDTPDANTTLIAGTVTTTQGVVLTGNSAGDTNVTIDVGTLPRRTGNVVVTLEVRINDPLPVGVNEVVNQGIVSGSNFSDVPTDDPNTSSVDDPTTDVTEIRQIEIPTLSEWGFILFALLLAAAAAWSLGRTRRTV